MALNRSSRLNKTLYSLPVHCLSDADIRMEHEKGIMFGFHRPENEANRFMASQTAFEKSILRDFQRPEPYNSKLQAAGGGLTSQLADTEQLKAVCPTVLFAGCRAVMYQAVQCIH